VQYKTLVLYRAAGPAIFDWVSAGSSAGRLARYGVPGWIRPPGTPRHLSGIPTLSHSRFSSKPYLFSSVSGPLPPSARKPSLTAFLLGRSCTPSALLETAFLLCLQRSLAGSWSLGRNRWSVRLNQFWTEHSAFFWKILIAVAESCWPGEQIMNNSKAEALKYSPK
jgi:hypothetical protein